MTVEASRLIGPSSGGDALRLPADTAFLPVDPGSRPVLAPLFRASGHRLCEYSYPIQVCWHDFNDSRWAIRDGWLFLRYVEDGFERFICPIGRGDWSAAIDACFRHLEARGQVPMVRFVPDAVASALDPARYLRLHDPDNDDYVYGVQDLAQLAGRRYAKKRNHIAQFLRGGAWSFDPVLPGDRPAIDAFLEAWCLDRECSGQPALDYEMRALAVCLDHLDELDIRAWLLRGAQGEILGLTAGAPLTDDTWAVHFEKGLSTRPGVYQILAREFARRVPEGVLWLDREQDMGWENLRRAKESLFPDHRERAWTVVPADRTPPAADAVMGA